MFDFSALTNWIHAGLLSFMPEWLAVTTECVLIGLVLLTVYALLALFYIYYERKVCAAFQCRLGPDRVGPMGLLQSFADMFKMLIKELISLKHTDKFLFALAPYLVILASMLAFAVLPWGNGLQVIDFNIGIFFLIAVSSIGVLGILLAGWSSNNKFTLIGALRSGAQMVSYELSIGLSVLTMVCLAGTMSVGGIVEEQRDLWFIFSGHIPAIIAFIIYLIAGTAETNRGPFDLPEAESELTAGYHTEYSGMHFGFFYLAEYLNLFIVSGVAALLFFGGWMPLHIPGWDAFNHVMDYIPSVIWFVGKAVVISFIIIWFKWTFPRLRIDQMLSLEWKYLLPINLFNLVLMVLVVVYGLHF
ncbi:NADH-quinone oxidoreductase subunit NuoH [Paramuribaculum intestinale]|jgi:NADH-quinone oxidoreductase subunit H|uniref:NADH-quinone oxidoreductase subunit H n=1 Tax=Paramuribaculum intestinale TaxID=2094151 RepID=A0A2V1IYE1_9BACT|nr:NADH-quinone oxidoreductase subunit NuoH [Paramuribaculum intestinale]MBJ2186214.1 NADH-quinone oxidoreductase subunit NuoH [Muribaculaceae bacterium]ROS91429.1 NADH-quinone oxidoreductase subunit NuoH [Muribaculaceae bacterium Isolate-043 (Harlan)]ROT13271.1 NADH-quinone oxidoreductase subunit NuoH [Muribaculaceae bacterium Isolate-105 (HZI)]RXE62198.1 NADH-quinone oxidoreductase subunit NuoH [Muribaculaceae bacterium Isolate-004 (NCI)]MCX4330050.1 NADH-quinone oxidoreductase subunit NuoH 